VKEDKTTTGVGAALMAFAGVMIGFGLIEALSPKVTIYVCPICGAEFTSETEREQHFVSGHPTEPIDVLWE
jgi:hypothetical protein